MPNLETTDELADWLADKLGIYDDSRCKFEDNDWHHVSECQCRVWWVPQMADRIRRAVANENTLERAWYDAMAGKA